MEDLLRRAQQGETGYRKKESRVYNQNHGIGETRTEETDVRRGREVLSLQKELGDQRVAFTKYRDMRTGEERNERDLRGVPDGGIEDFERRWAERSATTLRAPSSQLPIAPPSYQSSHTQPPPALRSSLPRSLR
eukprot:TRINITY_DN8698_c0_g5_i1.p2 TRINITY_DN8698_c0_g5~~TRINITY_DN8698_c0_g5_i1.p2  ORF type:complete len:134 (+),score=41.65 TRINITY_DN8698_c0_g5_i1:49-450(+)